VDFEGIQVFAGTIQQRDEGLAAARRGRKRSSIKPLWAQRSVALNLQPMTARSLRTPSVTSAGAGTVILLESL